MDIWDRIRAVLRREKRDLDDAIDDLTERGNAALERRERQLHASPAEKLAIEQERGEEIDADLDAVRRRIEGRDPGADAAAEAQIKFLSTGHVSPKAARTRWTSAAT